MGGRLTLGWLLLADGVLVGRVVVLLGVVLVLRVLGVLRHDPAVLRDWSHGRRGVERTRAPRVVVGTDRIRAGRAGGDGADGHGRFRSAAWDVGDGAWITSAADDDSAAVAIDVIVADGVAGISSVLLGYGGSCSRCRCPRTDGRIVVGFDDARRTVAVLVGFAAVQFVLLLVEFARSCRCGRRRRRCWRLVVRIDLARNASGRRPVRIDSQTQREPIRLLGTRLPVSTVETGLFKIRVHHFRKRFVMFVNCSITNQLVITTPLQLAMDALLSCDCTDRRRVEHWRCVSRTTRLWLPDWG